MNTNTTNTQLTVGFWFGQEKPVKEEDNFYAYTLYANTLVEQFEKFKHTYEEFKIKNPSPLVPYKDSLENEECFLIYENGEVEESTFLDLSLKIQLLKNIEDNKKRLEKEISNLEDDLINTFEESLKGVECKKYSLEEFFSESELKIIHSITTKSSGFRDLQGRLLKYFKRIKTSLRKRGVEYKYLSYAVAYSVHKNTFNS
ncbi:hypothetical protein [Halarcobacter sp.]|uniref:hypothetical protein n=1 Tax=Halarcobacter sp. TaxID=2321133 RepID=UPI002AAC05BA|nr:hypothetical protein [Halarcobacter sp.]